MTNFTSRWQKSNFSSSSDSEGIGAKLRNQVISQGPLKQKLEEAERQIQIQIAKLDQTSFKLAERDTQIFTKIVASVQKNENSRANMLANELTEVRKMNGMVMQAKLALEQLVLRLSTVRDLGDLAITLSPAVEVMKSIRPGLSTLVPDAEHEIGEISGLLSGILVEAGQIGTNPLTFDSANEEADKVIAEAEMIAEKRIGNKFPEVPTNTASEIQEAETA